MEPENFQQKLEIFCQKNISKNGALSDLRRLSGGASMESWAFVLGGEEFVLRRLPSGIDPDDDGLRGVPLSVQAELITLAVESGVTAPTVRAELSPADGLGDGFIMDKAEGETLPHKILGNPDFAKAEGKLPDQCAAELWKIHELDTSEIADKLEYFTPAELVGLQWDKYKEIGGRIPIYDFTFRWLLNNAPADTQKNLVHGDFRMGNLMITPDGISAVLDWELARLGDPVQDLAYLCTPSWRFGHYEKEAGGFDTAENFLKAYEKQSGQTVDRDRFRYWLVYSTLWWGVACMVMGEIWRTGGDRSLERTVIGRRVSEVEIDLLLLFADIMPDIFDEPLDWELPQIPKYSGETDYPELIAALEEWNAGTVLPGTSGHDKFQSRVAGNALGILKRWAEWGAQFYEDSEMRLASIGCYNEDLCDYLADGSFEAFSVTENRMTYEEPPGTFDHLRLSALERLSIDQPKYPGLHVALKRWSTKS